jgi:hypothetical protein
VKGDGQVEIGVSMALDAAAWNSHSDPLAE